MYNDAFVGMLNQLESVNPAIIGAIREAYAICEGSHRDRTTGHNLFGKSRNTQKAFDRNHHDLSNSSFDTDSMVLRSGNRGSGIYGKVGDKNTTYELLKHSSPRAARYLRDRGLLPDNVGVHEYLEYLYQHKYDTPEYKEFVAALDHCRNERIDRPSTGRARTTSAYNRSRTNKAVFDMETDDLDGVTAYAANHSHIFADKPNHEVEDLVMDDMPVHEVDDANHEVDDDANHEVEMGYLVMDDPHIVDDSNLHKDENIQFNTIVDDIPYEAIVSDADDLADALDTLHQLFVAYGRPTNTFEHKLAYKRTVDAWGDEALRRWESAYGRTQRQD